MAEKLEETYVLTRELVESARRAEYVTQSDPLFFQWQRGEKTKEEWLAAVQAINEANPYPVETKTTTK